MFVDVVELLTQLIPDEVHGLGLPTVGGDLGENVTAPLVQLFELPGGARHRPWNGPPLSDAYDIDVIVFSARNVPDDIGIGRDRAFAVRDWLNEFTHPTVTITADRRPRRLPDFNPHLLRFGVTISVLQRRAG